MFTCCMIKSVCVVGICHPKRGRRGVCKEQCITFTSQDAQVAFDDVARFDAILQKPGVTHYVVGKVSSNSNIVRAMNRGGANIAV